MFLIILLLVVVVIALLVKIYSLGLFAFVEFTSGKLIKKATIE